MENSLARPASTCTPSRLRTMTMDGTPRKAPLSAKKSKPQVTLFHRVIFALSDQLSKHNTDLQMDRFIPARSAMDLDVANFNLLKENNSQGNTVEVTVSPKV